MAKRDNLSINMEQYPENHDQLMNCVTAPSVTLQRKGLPCRRSNCGRCSVSSEILATKPRQHSSKNSFSSSRILNINNSGAYALNYESKQVDCVMWHQSLQGETMQLRKPRNHVIISNSLPTLETRIAKH
ncbi:uncharacterized protein LOC127864951 [Dreissena polymorpha]|uniref:uncharacterized protein LOC127864951 n=1 Tax=Dreissena polymorpha TaxID=45954 RepID=UPI0022648CA7|nr:uncharacterized protein LOC127864951 [Dreissena polymorpha]